MKKKELRSISHNFFTFPIEKIKIIFEDMPWVRKVIIQRKWPNTVIVNLEEHQVLGTWKENDKYLINTYGEIFMANLISQKNNNAILKLNGPDGSHFEVFQKMKKINQWIKPWNTYISSLDLSPRYAWIIQLNNGIVLYLGKESDLYDTEQTQLRINRLLQIWPQIERRWGESCIKSIDLRYINGYAIQVRENCERHQ